MFNFFNPANTYSDFISFRRVLSSVLGEHEIDEYSRHGSAKPLIFWHGSDVVTVTLLFPPTCDYPFRSSIDSRSGLIAKIASKLFNINLHSFNNIEYLTHPVQMSHTSTFFTQSADKNFSSLFENGEGFAITNIATSDSDVQVAVVDARHLQLLPAFQSLDDYETVKLVTIRTLLSFCFPEESHV